jgi:hypothetical protein
MRLARATTALALPLLGVVAVSGSASASPKMMTGAGAITCSYGTTLSFNPPLAEGLGTAEPAGVQEMISAAPATLGSCTGSATPLVPAGAASTKTLTWRWKGNRLGVKNYVGGCGFLSTFNFSPKGNAIYWTAASPLRHSTTWTAGNLFPDGSGYVATGTDTGGSFLGSVSITAMFTPSDASALSTCTSATFLQTGTGPTISSLTVDPTTSTISFGG